jgi:hypothetical protein
MSALVLWIRIHWTGVGEVPNALLTTLYVLTCLTYALTLFVVSSGLAFTRVLSLAPDRRIPDYLALTLSERRSILLLTLMFACVNAFYYFSHTTLTFYAVLVVEIVFYKTLFAHILHNTLALNGTIQC